jgi:hypothetical protein
MVRVEAAAGALFFGCHDALSGHDAGATLGSERTGAAYTKKNFLRKPFIICSLYRLNRYRLYTCTTHNGTYIVMCITVCIFHIPDFIILMHVITRLEYTVTYIDVDSLVDLYRNRIKSASGY